MDDQLGRVAPSVFASDLFVRSSGLATRATRGGACAPVPLCRSDEEAWLTAASAYPRGLCRRTRTGEDEDSTRTGEDDDSTRTREDEHSISTGEGRAQEQTSTTEDEHKRTSTRGRAQEDEHKRTSISPAPEPPPRPDGFGMSLPWQGSGRSAVTVDTSLLLTRAAPASGGRRRRSSIVLELGHGQARSVPYPPPIAAGDLSDAMRSRASEHAIPDSPLLTTASPARERETRPRGPSTATSLLYTEGVAHGASAGARDGNRPSPWRREIGRPARRESWPSIREGQPVVAIDRDPTRDASSSQDPRRGISQTATEMHSFRAKPWPWPSRPNAWKARETSVEGWGLPADGPLQLAPGTGPSDVLKILVPLVLTPYEARTPLSTKCSDLFVQTPSRRCIQERLSVRARVCKGRVGGEERTLTVSKLERRLESDLLSRNARIHAEGLGSAALVAHTLL
ncbi:hypothetical protein B2J93_561 [Marssonina coronariae]|uniref:Uncharacterized protein n=1 Tax=Diplocarpon coronariae TaxID=2795749 RepID=A0A218ZC11_9HELO|nr:hypothetical protein B2J93_561 [Marssonina coronariae]